MTAGGDLSALPVARLLERMARHLQAQQEHPVGSALWAGAVLGAARCREEFDRRLVEEIVRAVRERDED